MGAVDKQEHLGLNASQQWWKSSGRIHQPWLVSHPMWKAQEISSHHDRIHGKTGSHTANVGFPTLGMGIHFKQEPIPASQWHILVRSLLPPCRAVCSHDDNPGAPTACDHLVNHEMDIVSPYKPAMKLNQLWSWLNWWFVTAPSQQSSRDVTWCVAGHNIVEQFLKRCSCNRLGSLQMNQAAKLWFSMIHTSQLQNQKFHRSRTKQAVQRVLWYLLLHVTTRTKMQVYT